MVHRIIGRLDYSGHVSVNGVRYSQLIASPDDDDVPSFSNCVAPGRHALHDSLYLTVLFGNFGGTDFLHFLF